LYEAPENELHGSRMPISKNTTRVLEVTDFEKNHLAFDFKVEVEDYDVGALNHLKSKIQIKSSSFLMCLLNF
jgi:hypothetical protein